MRSMLSQRLIVIAGLSVAMFMTARDAAAFCRTTTCDVGSEECAKNDRGCIRDGVPVVWQKLPITYRFSKKGSTKIGDDDDALRAAVKKAFDTWSKVDCRDGRTSVRFVQGADISTDKPLNAKEASTPFGIYFRDKSWPHNDADESLALTNQIYGERSGNIDYADIEVNTANNTFSLDGGDGVDFQAVMIHEAGHYLGLAHSDVEDSIMVARYCQNADRCNGDLATLRELSTDDRNAVCQIYPPDHSDDSTVPPTTGGCTATTMRAPKDLATAFALVFLTTAILRRRRAGAFRRGQDAVGRKGKERH
jgi:hypothetical protein